MPAASAQRLCVISVFSQRDFAVFPLRTRVQLSQALRILTSTLSVSPTGDCRADHLTDLAARHPDVTELVVRCNDCARPEDRTLETVCQVLSMTFPGSR